MKTELSDEQLNVELCQWLGWKAIRYDYSLAQRIHTNPPWAWVGISPVTQMMEHGKDETKDFNYWTIPSHGDDLNAMRLAEAKIPDEDWLKYDGMLLEVSDWKVGKSQSRAKVSSSARQRLIAILSVVKPELFQ